MYINTDDEVTLLVVTDISGRRVKEIQPAFYSDETDMDISDLSLGIYFIQTARVAETTMAKFIKQ